MKNIKIIIVLLLLSMTIILSGCSDNPLATNELKKAENTKDPGFEAVFAILGLLIVTCLFLRKREKILID